MTGAGRGPAWGRDVASAPGRDWGQEGDISWPATGIFWDLLPAHVMVSPQWAAPHWGCGDESSEGQGLGEQRGEGGMGKEEERGREREITRENQLCHGICSSELWELRGFPAGRAGAEDAGCWGEQSPGTLGACPAAMPSARLSPGCGSQWLL